MDIFHLNLNSLSHFDGLVNVWGDDWSEIEYSRYWNHTWNIFEIKFLYASKVSVDEDTISVLLILNCWISNNKHTQNIYLIIHHKSAKFAFAFTWINDRSKWAFLRLYTCIFNCVIMKEIHALLMSLGSTPRAAQSTLSIMAARCPPAEWPVTWTPLLNN